MLNFTFEPYIWFLDASILHSTVLEYLKDITPKLPSIKNVRQKILIYDKIYKYKTASV